MRRMVVVPYPTLGAGAGDAAECGSTNPGPAVAGGASYSCGNVQGAADEAYIFGACRPLRGSRSTCTRLTTLRQAHLTRAYASKLVAAATRESRHAKGVWMLS